MSSQKNEEDVVHKESSCHTRRIKIIFLKTILLKYIFYNVTLEKSISYSPKRSWKQEMGTERCNQTQCASFLSLLSVATRVGSI